MSNSPNYFLAISGVFLVTWYGVRRLGREGKPRIILHEPGSPEYLVAAQAALAAEFHDPSAERETFPGGTVICPDCELSYPAGIMYCECGTETCEADDMDESISSPTSDDAVEVLVEDNEKLVCVHVADNHWKASLLKSFLENHNIPCATGGSSSSSPYSFTIGYLGEVRLLVHARNEHEARRLIGTCL